LSRDVDVTIKILQSEDEWDAVRRDWDDLYAVSPTASTPLDHAWLRGWWRVYRPTLRGGHLRVVTVWRMAQLIGALPLYVRRAMGGPFGARRLGFVSTGEAEFEETCPDYLNLLCRPGEEARCADAVWQAIGRMTWDYLELVDLPETTPLLRSGNVPPEVRRFSRGECPIADLTGGFEAYLQRLSSNSRQQARRLLRESERAGTQFELVGTNQAAAAFDDLVRLHQERWAAAGKPGVFAAPRFVEFHRRLVGQWLPSGRAVLARLSLGSDRVAVLYGFVTRRTFDFYQSGIRLETAGRLKSAGQLAHLLLMRALAQRGVDAYDFLRGSSAYKERMATRENRLIGARIWRPTPRTAAYRAACLARRLVRTG
jgi:CelD/BcsL family acetyltransferase involved in cellulose biosynthesis